MNRLIILLFVFIANYSLAESIDDIVNKKTDSLKSHGIEKIVIHQYSLFNGRFNISNKNEELRCDDIPTVVHIFWFDGGKWNCQRLDKCGLFDIVLLDKTNFDQLIIDDQIEFKKGSAHFTSYRLTKLFGDNSKSVLISGSQLTNNRNNTIKSFKKVNKVIKRLEDSSVFKRIK